MQMPYEISQPVGWRIPVVTARRGATRVPRIKKVNQRVDFLKSSSASVVHQRKRTQSKEFLFQEFYVHEET